MDEQTLAELSSLRARAYGPAADLATDPGALQRLRELEDLALSMPPPVAGEPLAGVEPSRTGAASTAPEVVLPPEGLGSGDAAVEASVEPVVRRLWWTPRRLAGLAALMLVAVVLVVVSITAAFTYRLQADPREVAVLRADPGVEWPQFFGDQGGQIFAEFYGLRAFSQQGYAPGSDRVECLQVAEKAILDADLQQGFSGAYYPGGCGAGSFPATAALVVGEGAPDELRERFADGTPLQFVLRGSEVVVLSGPPVPSPESG